MPGPELLAIALGYGLGSIPVGYLLVRVRTGRDLRRAGSGSTGATNVARLLGRPGFVAVFALDLLKGITAVLLAESLTDARWAVTGAAIAATVGHIWPVWLGFRGGKGLATAFGACLAFSPLVGVLTIATLIALLPFLRPTMVPLVGAVALAPAYALMVDRDGTAGVFLLAILILVGHRSNIRAVLPGGADHGRVSTRRSGRPAADGIDVTRGRTR